MKSNIYNSKTSFAPFIQKEKMSLTYVMQSLKRCLSLAILVVFISSCSNDFDGISPKEYVEQNNLNATELEEGMYIQIDEPGDDQRAEPNQVVLLDYRGIVANTGETALEGEDFTGVLSNLLLGWQIGLKEIGVGGTCTLILPPALAFGEQDITNIPPKSTMVFELTLKGIIDETTVDGYIERNNLNTIELAEGVHIVILEEGNDIKPNANTEIKVKYTGKLTNELIFDQREEAVFNLSTLIRGWQIGLAEIGEGGKCILVIPSEAGYGSEGAGNGVIPPNAPLVFEIELLEVGSAADDYVEEKGLNTQVLSNGVHIIIHDAGDENNKPNLNSSISVTYEGRLTSEYIFDSGTDVTFQLGGLIEGWKIGLQEIGQGGSCTLIIPSSVGYGGQPNGDIPANSVLIFDIDLLAVN